MALTGNEVLQVLGQTPAGKPAAETFQTTTGAIAALASIEYSGNTVTNISTAGNGTLTAAALAGGVINRSGPTAVYTDTTATAAQLYSQTGSDVNVTFYTIIKNTVPFTQTLAGGTGITFSGQTLIPANSVGTYLVTFTNATAAVFRHVQTVPLTTNAIEVVTTLSTVGAGTVTAAGIAGAITSRTGSQSGTPFTDTTDTAANIIAAMPNAHIGQSFEYTYQNTTNAVATLTGGVGVTVSGITSVLAGASARFLVTYTAAATINMVGFQSAQAASASQQSAVFAGSTSGTTTLKASAVAGTTTQTLPAVTGVTASTSGSNLAIIDIKRTSAAVTANATTTYANVTGLSQTVVVGTYAFRCVLPSTVASGTGGIKYAFNYTTAVLSSLQSSAAGFTASAVAVQNVTSTTTQADLFTQAEVVIRTVIEGTMVVTTGGTVDLQVAQNTSDVSNTIAIVGGSMEFVRIA